MTAQAESSELLTRIAEVRRRLHRIPELAFEEFKTAQLIRGELSRLGIDFIDGVPDAPTATIALIGDASKPCIALRADIDALPIIERTGLPYASTHAGCMHACGHDGHMATLIGTAERLTQLAGEIGVCVKLIFQPAEEGGGGASRLVEAGVLDGRLGPKVERIFGLHGWPGLKVGTVATKAGAILASTDNFQAVFVGRGCHGAYPHWGRDPITTAAEAVVSLQKFVSRELDPTDSAVITVGKFHAGTATNIIPDEATIEATVRTILAKTRQQARDAIERRCRGIADANDCELRFVWIEGYPATINDAAMADVVGQVARETVGTEGFVPIMHSSLGGEDFAYYLQKVPGCFFFVGVEPAERNGYPSLHSDRFDFTDAALEVGIAMFVNLVKHFGQQLAPSGR